MAVEWLRISGGGRDASVVATASAASAAVLLLEIACRLILLVVSLTRYRSPFGVYRREECLAKCHRFQRIFTTRAREIFPSVPPSFAATFPPPPPPHHLTTPFLSLSVHPSPFLPYFLLFSLLRVYPILFSGHGIFPSSVFSLLSVALLSANVLRIFFLACTVVRADSTRTRTRARAHLPVYVCARALCSTHET